jgi:sortase A
MLGNDASQSPAPPRRRASARVTALGAIGIMLGLAILGATFAVLSDQEADRDLTRRRIAEIEATTPGIIPTISVPTPTEPRPTPTGEARAEPPPIAPLSPTTAPDDESGPTPTAAPLPRATLTPNPDAQSTPIPTPPPVPTAARDMPPPTHISIPAVGLDTAVVEVTSYVTQISGSSVITWEVSNWAAGHNDTSASPGEGGNIVINGHDARKIFYPLHSVEIGDEVVVTSPGGTFTYVVKEIHLRKEQGMPLEERLAVGMFMAPMGEERLTLITCWPYGVDDHRLIVVAKPVATAAAP